MLRQRYENCASSRFLHRLKRTDLQRDDDRHLQGDSGVCAFQTLGQQGTMAA